MTEFQARYLVEASRRLHREGFAVWPEYEGLVPIEKGIHQFCHINMHGGMLYDQDYVRRNGLEEALERVRCITAETLTYMKQMASAPRLVADGLTGNYRLLAEFGDVVLAGHERTGGHGVEFVTWQRIQDGTSLWDGHYYDNDYAAAKQDFAVRSGLLPPELLFTQEQLAVIFDAAQNMTTLDLVSNPEQGKLLEGIMKQIEEAAPQVIDLANELTQYPQQHRSGEMQLY